MPSTKSNAIIDAKNDNKSPSRVERRKLATRAKLLEAAYKVMSTKGIDAATLQEITDEADVGFGTVYNYFSGKEELAEQVLDCVIDDFGRRNDAATAKLREEYPAAASPASMRLVLREAMVDPMWRWWLKRPELLADRMTLCFRPFGLRDIKLSVENNSYSLIGDDLEKTWATIMWIYVGGLRDLVLGSSSYEHKNQIIEAILRVLGVPLEECNVIVNMPLPEYGKADINFNFSLEKPQLESPE
jgi:AcrR family transcriptional regulator